MSPPVLELLSVSRVYGSGAQAVHALDGVSLELDPADVVAVVGPSGSGKTTLLQLAGGIDRPSAGRVLQGGQDLGELTRHELTLLRRRHMGFVFQFFNLVPALSALENVALPLRLDGVRRAEARRRAAELLERVGLSHREGHQPNELSGGEQQRVAIARALVTEPRLILADEPTGNLDRAAGQDIVRLLVDAAQERATAVLIVTHDPRVLPHVQRIVVLSDGRIRDEDAEATVLGEVLT